MTVASTVFALSLLLVSKGAGDSLPPCLAAYLDIYQPRQRFLGAFCPTHGSKLVEGCTEVAIGIEFTASPGYRLASILYFPLANTYALRYGGGYIRLVLSDALSVQFCPGCREIALAWVGENADNPNRDLWHDFSLLQATSGVSCENLQYTPIRGF